MTKQTSKAPIRYGYVISEGIAGGSYTAKDPKTGQIVTSTGSVSGGRIVPETKVYQDPKTGDITRVQVTTSPAKKDIETAKQIIHEIKVAEAVGKLTPPQPQPTSPTKRTFQDQVSEAIRKAEEKRSLKEQIEAKEKTESDFYGGLIHKKTEEYPNRWRRFVSEDLYYIPLPMIIPKRSILTAEEKIRKMEYEESIGIHPIISQPFTVLSKAVLESIKFSKDIVDDPIGTGELIGAGFYALKEKEARESIRKGWEFTAKHRPMALFTEVGKEVLIAKGGGLAVEKTAKAGLQIGRKTEDIVRRTPLIKEATKFRPVVTEVTEEGIKTGKRFISIETKEILSPEKYAKILSKEGEIIYKEVPIKELQGLHKGEITLGKAKISGLFDDTITEIKIAKELKGFKKQSTIAHELIHHKTPRIITDIDWRLGLPYKLQPTEMLAFGLQKSKAIKGFKIKKEIKIPLIEKGWETIPLKVQAEVAGTERMIVSASRDFFGRLGKTERVIDKPLLTAKELTPTLKKQVGVFMEGKLTPAQILKLERELVKKGTTLREKALFFDPYGKARVSRLFEKDISPKLFDIDTFISGELRMPPRAELLVYKGMVEKLPKDILTKLKTGKPLTPAQESKLLLQQLTPTKKIKPIGFLSTEPEVLLAPREILKKHKILGTTIIEGKKVKIIETKIGEPSKRLQQLRGKEITGIISQKEMRELSKLYTKETGIKRYYKTPDRIPISRFIGEKMSYIPTSKQPSLIKDDVKYIKSLDISKKIISSPPIRVVSSPPYTPTRTPTIPRIHIPTYTPPKIPRISKPYTPPDRPYIPRPDPYTPPPDVPKIFRFKTDIPEFRKPKVLPKQKPRELLYYTPDFTARALGIKPIKVTQKQAIRLLKMRLTGLEVRPAVILKDRKIPFERTKRLPIEKSLLVKSKKAKKEEEKARRRMKKYIKGLIGGKIG